MSWVGEAHLDERERNASESRGVHKLLEVLVQKLKNQVKLILCVDDIQQPAREGPGVESQQTESILVTNSLTILT